MYRHYRLLINRFSVLVLVICAGSSCATVQSGFILLGDHAPVDSSRSIVEVFLDDRPTRDYRVHARLDTHFEKTHFIGTAFSEALEQLKIQAHLSGSHAIIDLKESKSRVGETRIYHVTATGIRYVE